MKIIHICLACFYIENMEYQENVLPRKHKKMGHDVRIISSRYTFEANGTVMERSSGTYTNDDGINVTIIDYCEKIGKLSRILRIFEDYSYLLTKENPDIIFIHGLQFFSVEQIIKYKKNNPNVIIYADNHGDYINAPINTLVREFVQKYVWGHCVRKVIPFVEKIWGVTPAREMYLQQVYGVPPEKTDLLVMGGDEEKIDFLKQPVIRRVLREQYGIDDTDFILLTGGKIDVKKNIHLLMEAVAAIDIESIKLVVFGLPNETMKEIIEKIATSNKIIYIGWIPSDQVYNWFLASDLAVFPGTHSVLWEQAVASGIPCVFKKWPGMQHVDVGGNCMFLENSTIIEMKNVIRKIITDKDLYREMKRKALEQGSRKFSYMEIAKKSIGISSI